MAIQRLTSKDFGALKNPGVTSAQIVWGKNSPDAKVTITRVTVEPGAVQVIGLDGPVVHAPRTADEWQRTTSTEVEM